MYVKQCSDVCKTTYCYCSHESWPHALHLLLSHPLKKTLPLTQVVTPPNLNKKHDCSHVIPCHLRRKLHVPFARLLTMQRLRSLLLLLTLSFPVIILSWKFSQRSITQNWSTSKNSPPSQVTTSKEGPSEFRMQSCMQNPWRSMEVCMQFAMALKYDINDFFKRS
jgi:hypothetical protein